jgi:hypothetical protein
MPSGRRQFLEQLTGATALAAVSAAGSGELAAPFETPQGSVSWDTSWTSRIGGKHRVVFDATEIEDGAGMLRAMIWRLHYADVLKVPPAEMTAVLVLRHNAIALAMNQEYWDRYRIGPTKNVRHPFTEAPTTKNPILLAADELPDQFSSLNLAGLQRTGGIVLACDLAFGQCVREIAKAESVEAAEARKRGIAMLNPGIILQPSGVFATILAQEQGCRYLKAS